MPLYRSIPSLALSVASIALVALLAGCAATGPRSPQARPVIYSSAAPTASAQAQQQTATDDCIARAQAQGLTPDEKNNEAANRAGKGAAVGGVAAAVGALVTGRGVEGVVRSGAVGAAVGGAIGADMATQKAELERSLSGTGAQVGTSGNMLTVILPENVTFPTGSDVVNSGFLSALNAISKNLQTHSRSTVLVVGHTDNVGSMAYNDDLSMRRALSVSRILIADGLATARLSYTGKGEAQPIASNATADGRAMNRRVEIYVGEAAR